MATQPGGSANIYGVTYQTLRILDRAGFVAVRAIKTGDDLESSVFVIEPAGGGGDFQLRQPQGRIVEQLKASSGESSWSLNSFINDVIPDLYLAVDLSRIDGPDHYYFVTEGHRGRWGGAQTFFNSLRDKSRNVHLLNDKIVIAKTKDTSYTERSLFDAIATECKTRAKQDDDATVHTKLWHLLPRIRVKSHKGFDEIRRRLRRYFSLLADDPGNVERVIDQAFGFIATHASRGSFTLTPQFLLRELGLAERPFYAWQAIRSASHLASRSRLHRAGYRPQFDVRPFTLDTSIWTINSPIIVVPSESGQGSTWQSGSLFEQLTYEPQVTLWMSLQDNATSTLHMAADRIWGEVLSRFSAAPTLDQLSRLRREQAPQSPEPWLNIIIDDVKSPSDAQHLLNQPWTDWGARLALFTTTAIAQSIKVRALTDATVMAPVQDFTPSQLRDLLTRHSRSPEHLPSDVFNLLLRPIVAGIYLKLDTSAGWHATSEYAICNEFHKRLRTFGVQAEHPSDVVILRRLAMSLLEGGQYPWSGEALRSAGLNDDMRLRLEHAGWIQRPYSDEHAAVWHDRLLNWLIAEALVAWRRDGRHTQTVNKHDFTSRVVNSRDHIVPGKDTHLGYVLGDVLWLLTRSDNHEDIKDAAAVMAAIDEHFKYNHDCGEIYRVIVSSIGYRVLPVLEHRLRDTTGKQWNPLPSYVNDCVLKISRDSPAQCDAHVQSWIEDDCAELQAAAMEILAERPLASVIDIIWDRHKSISRLLDELPVKERPYREYERGNQVMRATTAANLQWLLEKIRTSDSSDPSLKELAWLLAASPEGTADAEWPQIKSHLIESLQHVAHRPLIACIRRFHDMTEIPRLEAWILSTSNGHDKGFAFSTLAQLHPTRAIELIEKLIRNEAYMMRYHWLPRLMIADPDHTREAIRRQMVTSERPFKTAMYYQGNEHLIDPNTLELMANELERLLDRHLNGQEEPRQHPLYLPLDLLAKVSSPDSLAKYRTLANTNFEAKLTTAAINWSKQWNHVNFNAEIVNALSILLKIGGTGFAQVINQELRADYGKRWHLGTQWAVVSSDNETKRLLAETAFAIDHVKAADTQHQIDSGTAVQSLIALGEIEVAIDALSENRLLSFLGNAEDIVGEPLKISDDLLSRLIEVCENRGRESWPLLYLLASTKHKRASAFLQKMLGTVAPDASIATAVLKALRICGVTDIDLDSIRPYLNHTGTCIEAINLLASINRAVAIQEFAGIFQQGTAQEHIRIAVWLCYEQDGRDALLDRLADRIINNSRLLLSSQALEVIGYSSREDVHDLLDRTAKSVGFVRGSAANAIRGLAKTNPSYAFRVAIAAWSEWERDREYLPSILIDIDRPQGLEYLFDQLPHERDLEVRRYICLMLRRHLTVDEVLQWIIPRCTRADPKYRAAALEVTGWLSLQHERIDSTLLNIIDAERDSSVFSTAVDAHVRRGREVQARRLVELAKATVNNRYVTLESVVDLVDPLLLNNVGDSLGFAEEMANLHPIKCRLLNRKIEKHDDKLKRDRDLKQRR
ncbi:MAG: hypothetical protein IT445_06270 [Phycisphaeraceae bacterium]|nr:hypothetical protein [Phycisphaeraceae bacterium]